LVILILSSAIVNRHQCVSIGVSAPGHCFFIINVLMLLHYAAAGITTDHENQTLEEAREKIAADLKVLIR